MSFALPFTRAAKEKKEAKAVLAAARTFVLSYEDLPAYRDGGEFAARLQNLREAWTAKNVPECRSLLEILDPPKSFAFGREWLDILVVSISVAMAFRAYFYEPFNIPTGSMQPTLYGNHYEPCDNPGVIQTTPLKWLNWFATGRDYKEYVAPFSGRVGFSDRNDGRIDLFVANAIGRKGICLPKDVLEHLDFGSEAAGAEIRPVPSGPRSRDQFFCVRVGESSWMPITVPTGHRLFRGYDTTGDFLFVNRWLWNFRHPRRGDVMIFSTTGIRNLQPGTHYIKRMTGVPGETLEVKKDGHLWVDGRQPMEPQRIRQIQNREKWHEKAYPYAGYGPGGITWKVTLGADEYYACGDNSPNSYDSRYWGPVPARNLCGIAGGVFWPIVNPRWGTIK